MTIEKTKNYYDGISRGYKNLYHKEQQNKIKNILSHIQKIQNKNILDLGSGDGVLNQFVHSSNKLISTDLSFELLKLNPNKSKNKINSSILNLPFKDNSFDVIISLSVFQDLPNIEKAFNETSRILKSNCIFILTFIKYTKKIKLLQEQINKHFKTIEKIEEEKDLIYILEKK